MTECYFLGFELLEFRLTNQIYIFITKNTSSDKLGNQAVHLIKQSDWPWMKLGLLVFQVTDS